MTKLSYDHALNLIQEAHNKIQQHDGYRFGQALTNLLPRSLYEQHNATGIDFFYWTDYDMIINCFYKHYVSND